jgi:hypothetical protein
MLRCLARSQSLSETRLDSTIDDIRVVPGTSLLTFVKPMIYKGHGRNPRRPFCIYRSRVFSENRELNLRIVLRVVETFADTSVTT